MDPLSRPAGQLALENEPDGRATLRARQTPRSERRKIGKSLRKRVARSSLGDWTPPPNRRDPVDQVNTAHEGRLDWLVPIRVGRMVASPYGFLRGTAGLMAEDMAAFPATGITPVICGDAHVGNFGFYGSPERELVIDLNDFDEAHPGPWEWDLRRLAASIWVAGRQNGLTESQCETATTSCVSAYRLHLGKLSERPLFDRSFDRVDFDGLTDHVTDPGLLAEIQRAAERARRRTSDHAVPRRGSRTTTTTREPAAHNTTHPTGHRLPFGRSRRISRNPCTALASSGLGIQRHRRGAPGRRRRKCRPTCLCRPV